jgi:hypothetical protein
MRSVGLIREGSGLSWEELRNFQARSNCFQEHAKMLGRLTVKRSVRRLQHLFRTSSYLDSHNTGWAWLLWEVGSLIAPGENGLQACVSQTFLGSIECRRRRVADSHAKALDPINHLF